MFGNNDQNNQQQDSSFGATMPSDPMAVADGSLSSDNPAGSATQDSSNGLGGQHGSSLVVPEADVKTTANNGSVSHGNDELLNIKQGALQQLSPLVGHLDQTPEEKFRTTMMMIQASDDQSLIKEAYEAAQKISDDKARAQALLDVINEINYFTQQHNK